MRTIKKPRKKSPAELAKQRESYKSPYREVGIDPKDGKFVGRPKR